MFFSYRNTKLPIIETMFPTPLFITRSLSSTCKHQVVFLASAGKSAKLVDRLWLLINDLKAPRWGARWHTYERTKQTVTCSHFAENDLFTSGGCVSRWVGQAAGKGERFTSFESLFLFGGGGGSRLWPQSQNYYKYNQYVFIYTYWYEMLRIQHN